MSDMDSVSQNWAARVELAAAFRIVDKEGLNEGITNHFTLKAPAASGRGEVMLTNPYGMHWSQVTASSLIGYSIEEAKIVEGSGEIFDGVLGIHVPIHKLRPDARCILHVHGPYSTAITMTKNFTHLPMTHHNTCMFYGRTAVGTAFRGQAGKMSSGERIHHAMQGKDVVFLRHHGTVVVAPTVARAVQDTYFLERVCMLHVVAASSGQEVEEIDEEVVKQTHDAMMKTIDSSACKFFGAMMSCLERDSPGFNK